MNSTILPQASRLVDNLQCAQLVARKDLALEQKLYSTKWFDYRFISPLKATEQFYDQFRNRFRQQYKKNIDIFEGEMKTGVSAKGLLNRGREFTTVWKARQFADELGVPYNIFLGAAFELFERAGWSRLPHCNQLYGEKNRERIRCAVEKRWRETLDDRFTVSMEPQYRDESFQNFSGQLAHREWALALLKVSWPRFLWTPHCPLEPRRNGPHEGQLS